MEKPDYPFAFPTAFYADQEMQKFYAGMTLRDYFAAKAMSSANIWDVMERGAEIASRSYALADAMLVEREKSSKQ